MSDRTSEQDLARRQYAALAKHYHAIGPADLLAALMAMQSTPKEDAKPADKRKAA
ncbi:MAG TPA: transcriptional regulator [Rhizobiaceae bacterium]|nr:transcriptional regulator [Rhizobiaceae bacterium]